jgi:hypothetical protein
VRRDAETRAGQFYIVELAGCGQTREVSSVHRSSSWRCWLQIRLDIGINGDWKRSFLTHQLECRRGNEKAFERLEAFGSFHPDIARIEPALSIR